MKNFKIKWFLLLLVSFLFFSNFINTSFAEWETSEFCFNFTKWTIIKYLESQSNNNKIKCPKDVIIPLKINWILVDNIWSRAFQDKKLTSIIIPNWILKIYRYAFSDNNLTSVIIPDSVIKIWENSFSYNEITFLSIWNSVKKIDRYAFYYNKLFKINIPEHVNEIWIFAFSRNKLSTINLFDNNIEIKYWAFFYNKNYINLLHKIDISEDIFDKNTKIDILFSEKKCWKICVEKLKNIWWINSIEDYNLNSPMKREELVKILIKTFWYKKSNKNSLFKDLKYSKFPKYINKASELWIIESSYDRNYFYPQDFVNKAEAVKMILKASNLKITYGKTPFWNFSKNIWYSKLVSFWFEKRIISWPIYSNFYPSEKMPKWEIAEIIIKTIEYKKWKK